MTALKQVQTTPGHLMYYLIIVCLCIAFILGMSNPSYAASDINKSSSLSFSREEMVEKGFSAWALSDGGYVFASYTFSETNLMRDLLLIKTSSEGNIVWQKTYGGNGDEQANAIRETNDGGYIVCGYTTSIKEKGKDIYLLKLKANGDVQWEKNYGGRTESEKRSESTHTTTLPNGFNVKNLNSSKGLSHDYYDVFVLVKDEGSKDKTQDNGSYTEDEGIAVTPSSDGGFVVAGYTKPTGGVEDICLIKVDFRGVLKWARSLGGGSDDRPSCIEECRDNGFILAGYTRSVGLGSRNRSQDETADRSDKDVYLVKTDNRGYLEWQQTYGGKNDDEATCVGENEMGYAIGAYYIQDKQFGKPGVLLIQTDRYGKEKWQTKLLNNSVYQFPTGVESLPGGYIVLAGNTINSRGSESFVMKYNSQGSRLWERRWKGNGELYIHGLLVKDSRLVLYGTMASIDINQKGRLQLNPMLLEYSLLGQLLDTKSVAGSHLKSVVSVGGEQEEKGSSSQCGYDRTPPESPMQKGSRGSLSNE